MPTNNVTTVPFGWTSIIGYASSALVAIKLAIHGIEVGQVEATAAGGNKWLALYVIIATTATTIIRGMQSTAKIKTSGSS